jgi:hypothetical protein
VETAETPHPLRGFSISQRAEHTRRRCWTPCSSRHVKTEPSSDPTSAELRAVSAPQALSWLSVRTASITSLTSGFEGEGSRSIRVLFGSQAFAAAAVMIARAATARFWPVMDTSGSPRGRSTCVSTPTG